jgi:hypothetical protein
VAPGPPTKSIAAATKSSPRLAGTAGSSAASASAQHISSGLLEVLLASAPELLRAQVRSLAHTIAGAILYHILSAQSSSPSLRHRLEDRSY